MNIKQGFYNFFQKEIESKLSDFFDKIVKNKKISREKIQAYQKQIFDNTERVNKSYIDNNIKKRKWNAVKMGVGRFFTFGQIYKEESKENKNVIQIHKKLSLEMNEENFYLKNDNVSDVNSFFTGLTFFSVFKAIFEEFKMPISYDWDDNDLSYQNIFDKTKGCLGCIKFFVRNNPVYLFHVACEWWINIKTKGHVTRTYQKKVYRDGKMTTVTRTKIITAYHEEPAPKDSLNYQLLYKTNYLNKLTFSFRNVVNKKNKAAYKNFENINFFKLIDVFPDNKNTVNDVYLHQFFSIKAQENFVSLSQIRSLNNIYKFDAGLMLPVKSNIFNNQTSWLNDNFSLNFLINNEKNFNLDQVKEQFINYFQPEMLSVAFALEHALSVPGIASEKFEENNYKISENLVEFKKLVNQKLTISRIFTKIHYGLSLYATSFEECGLIPKMTSIEKSVIDKNIYVIDFQYNSYFVQKEIDIVTVYDSDCGAVQVPVPYKRYYPKKEFKQIYFVEKNTDNDVVFKLNEAFKFYEQKKAYDLNFLSEFYDKEIIILNIENIQDAKKYKSLIVIFNKFKEISSKLNQTINLRIDKEGAYIFINKPEKAQIYQKSIYEILQTYKNLKF